VSCDVALPPCSSAILPQQAFLRQELEREYGVSKHLLTIRELLDLLLAEYGADHCPKLSKFQWEVQRKIALRNCQELPTCECGGGCTGRGAGQGCELLSRHQLCCCAAVLLCSTPAAGMGQLVC